MKKVISILLCVTLMLAMALPCFAQEKTSYPFIFVHGMMGWGEDSIRDAEMPYWGLNSDDNIITYLRSEGYEVYCPSVSGLGSAWDRACELYAQLTGTTVDYGEAHSEQMGHERFGRDFSGRACMGTPWDLTTKINLIGHSFGGATVRLLASLLAYGDEAEMAKSGENCSELFKGGHADVIYSITTLSAPHNGSQVTYPLVISKLPVILIAFLMNYSAVTGGNWDPMLDQWGISTDPTTGEKASINLAGCIKVAKSGDHCGIDMTLEGAEALNAKIKVLPNTYYFSSTTQITQPNALGIQIPGETCFDLFKLTSPIISLSKYLYINDRFLGEEWTPNDGIVPLISALYPFGDAHEAYTTETQCQTGVWYLFETMQGKDHYDYCRVGDGFATREELFGFYTDLLDLINGI